MNKQAEDCREQLEILNNKLKECREQIKNETDADKRFRLKSRATTIRQAIRDIKLQLEHFAPETKVKKNAQTKIVRTDGFEFDFFERTNSAWSDMEGKTWKQIEQEQYTMQTGETSSEMQEWMAEGAERLTEKQAIYIDEYFNEGLSMQVIADKYGVRLSTISRVIKRGIKKMQDWVEAKQLISTFLKPDGTFDWVAYLEKISVVSDRQRELLLIVLTKLPKDSTDIARKLEIHQSTVSRTLARASKTVKKLKVKGEPSILPYIASWDEADKWSLAVQLGMPLYFYYRFCFDRNERYCGLTRYKYELTKRVKAGKTPSEISKEFGISLSSAVNQCMDIKRRKLCDRLSKEENAYTIKANLSDEVYVKLQQLINGYNK